MSEEVWERRFARHGARLREFVRTPRELGYYVKLEKIRKEDLKCWPAEPTCIPLWKLDESIEQLNKTGLGTICTRPPRKGKDLDESLY